VFWSRLFTSSCFVSLGIILDVQRWRRQPLLLRRLDARLSFSLPFPHLESQTRSRPARRISLLIEDAAHDLGIISDEQLAELAESVS